MRDPDDLDDAFVTNLVKDYVAGLRDLPVFRPDLITGGADGRIIGELAEALVEL